MNLCYFTHSQKFSKFLYPGGIYIYICTPGLIKSDYKYIIYNYILLTIYTYIRLL